MPGASSTRKDGHKGASITVRFPDDLATEIALIARTKGQAISEVIRDAADHYLVSLRSDEGFQKLLRHRVEEDRAILARYGGGGE
jgi:hypothetical protein